MTVAWHISLDALWGSRCALPVSALECDTLWMEIKLLQF